MKVLLLVFMLGCYATSVSAFYNNLVNPSIYYFTTVLTTIRRMLLSDFLCCYYPVICQGRWVNRIIP